MPIQDTYPLPQSPQNFPVPSDASKRLFVCFIASDDPVTNAPWCSDVRASLPRLNKTFSSLDAPDLLYIHVGQKAEWKVLDNVFRKEWEIKAIPTMIRYQRVDGKVKEMGRLVEGELVDDGKYDEFVTK